ncbi:MAG: hypothetical protein N2512_06340 [Armatimonadetes bacterium]|nr:hypothetical protein [Armatimonadota bacterium]
MKAPLIFLAWVLTCATALGQDITVTNPGFEDADAQGVPVGWRADPAVYQVDDTVAHSGRCSLRYVNDDPNRYVMCAQDLPLKPGHMYEFSVWVKTRGIEGEDTGATICLEWQGEGGKYLGGSYPAGIKGDNDWTLIRGISGRVPAEAVRCHVLCYVRNKMTGTAWFDDVQIKRVFADPLREIVVTRPNYRGWLWPGKPPVVEVDVLVDKADLDCDWADLSVRLQVLSTDGNPVAEKTFPAAAQLRPALSLPADLRPGRYELQVSLIDQRTGKTLSSKGARLTKLQERPAPTVYIDEHNRLIVEGQPFFPLGCYWSVGEVNEDTIAVYADSAFNCFMPYGSMSWEQMNLAHRHGLKVIYSIKDNYAGTTWCPAEIKTPEDERPFTERYVEEFRDHPALLAWYLNDELGLEFLERLAAHQQWLEEWDPNHPTWVVLYQVGQVREYIRTFDAIGTDPYPIPEHPRRAAEWTRATVENVARARPVWMVPQIFNWKCYNPQGNGRTPTYEEMRSMAWQCICEGAMGLIFYSFFDIRRDPDTPFDEHWPRVKQMAAEIKHWVPVLLSVDEPLAVTVKGEAIHARVQAHGGSTYIFVVNDDYETREAAFTLRPGWRLKRLSDGQVLSADGRGRATDQLGGLDMQVYEVLAQP